MATTPAPKPKFPYEIFITPEALVKTNEYARAALPTEIGGFARLQINKEEKRIYIIDVAMLEQKTQAAYFEVHPDAVNKWTREMIKAGRADELSEWRSLVHSHPVNHAPSMSSVDVDHIKQFASDEDAFSFILTASETAASQRMFMHYAYSAKAESTSEYFEGGNFTYVIHDIPVKVAYSADRLTAANKIVKKALKDLGGEDFSEEERTKLTNQLTRVICNDTPIYPHEERMRLRKEIEAHTEEIITREDLSKTRGSRQAAGFRTRELEGLSKEDREMIEALDGGWDSAAAREYMRDQAYMRSADDSKLTPSEQRDVGYTKEPAKGSVDLERRKDEVIRLEILWQIRQDPRTGQPIGRKRAKKAYRMWVRRVTDLNKLLRKEFGVGLYDQVVVDYEKIKSHRTRTDKKFEKEPGEVVDFIDNGTACSFAVGVHDDAELFWDWELKVEQMFEDYVDPQNMPSMGDDDDDDESDDPNDTPLTKEEQESEMKRLAQASAELDSVLNSDPKDETPAKELVASSKKGK